jgi:hypothetical protein
MTLPDDTFHKFRSANGGNVSSWHKADMRRASLDVRFRG